VYLGLSGHLIRRTIPMAGHTLRTSGHLFRRSHPEREADPRSRDVSRAADRGKDGICFVLVARGRPRESEKPKRKPRTAYHDAPKARTAEPHQRANMTLTVRKCVRERIRVARATTTLHVRTTRSNRTKVQRSTLHQFLGEVWVNERG